MAFRTFPLAGRSLVAIPLLLSALCVSGCDPEAYPEDMAYPARTDPLFISAPTDTQPVGLDSPGQLNELPKRIGELRGQVLDPKDIAKKKEAKDRKQLEEQLAQMEKRLTEVFGKPAHPIVKGTIGDSEEKISEALGLGNKTLREGGMLYRRHCLHCHGVTGDGHGPTAPWVNPHPRDYRQGIFKFTSTNQPEGSRKPRREDLKRTLKAGIEGTSMPSFAMLPEEELDKIVSYVIHLSLRGETEFAIMRKLLLDEDLEADNVAEAVNNKLSAAAANWQQAQAEEKVIKPGPYPGLTKESVQSGYKLFTEKKGAGACVSCHSDFGRKNNYRYDSWGTIVRPIDLTSGVYRGGRRPLDLYYRIYSGINGAGMPGFSTSLIEGQSDKKIWDVVNFLQVLPYPKMREEYGINIDE